MDTQKPDRRRAMEKEIDARLFLLAITVAVVGFTLSSIVRRVEADTPGTTPGSMQAEADPGDTGKVP